MVSGSNFRSFGVTLNAGFLAVFSQFSNSDVTILEPLLYSIHCSAQCYPHPTPICYAQPLRSGLLSGFGCYSMFPPDSAFLDVKESKLCLTFLKNERPSQQWIRSFFFRSICLLMPLHEGLFPKQSQVWCQIFWLDFIEGQRSFIFASACWGVRSTSCKYHNISVFTVSVLFQ